MNNKSFDQKQKNGWILFCFCFNFFLNNLMIFFQSSILDVFIVCGGGDDNDEIIDAIE